MGTSLWMGRNGDLLDSLFFCWAFFQELGGLLVNKLNDATIILELPKQRSRVTFKIDLFFG